MASVSSWFAQNIHISASTKNDVKGVNCFDNGKFLEGFCQNKKFPSGFLFSSRKTLTSQRKWRKSSRLHARKEASNEPLGGNSDNSGVFSHFPKIPLGFLSIRNEWVHRIWQRRKTCEAHCQSEGRGIIHISKFQKGFSIVYCFILVGFRWLQRGKELLKEFVSIRKKTLGYICWSLVLFAAVYASAESYARSYLNASYLPAVTAGLSETIGRKVVHGNVKRVSPFGIELQSCSLGPYSDEFSCAELPSVKLRLRPLDSLRRFHPVFDAVLERPQVLVSQKEDWTWLGIPTPAEKGTEKHSPDEEGIDSRTKVRRIARDKACRMGAVERNKAAREAAEKGYRFVYRDENGVKEGLNSHEKKSDKQLYPKSVEDQMLSREEDAFSVNLEKAKSWFDGHVVKPILPWLEKSFKKKAYLSEKEELQRRILDCSATAAKKYFRSLDLLKSENSKDETGGRENGETGIVLKEEVSSSLTSDGEKNHKDSDTFSIGSSSSRQTEKHNSSPSVYSSNKEDGQEFTSNLDVFCLDNQCDAICSKDNAITSEEGFGSADNAGNFEVQSFQHPSVDFTDESKTKQRIHVEAEQSEGFLSKEITDRHEFEENACDTDGHIESGEIQLLKPSRVKMPGKKKKAVSNNLNLKVTSALASIRVPKSLMQENFPGSIDKATQFPIFVGNMMVSLSNGLSTIAERWKKGAKSLIDQAKDVEVNSIGFKSGTLMLLGYGDEEPRVMDDILGQLEFQNSYDCFNLQLSGKPMEWRTGQKHANQGELTMDASFDISQQNWHAKLKGKRLFAPLFERLLDIPIIWHKGLASGEVDICMTKGEDIPRLYGTLDVQGLVFQIIDAPSSFSDLNGRLCFEGQQIFLHNVSGFFGEVPLEVSGGFGINPDDGEFRLMCQVPNVEINSLMRSLDAKPFLFPLAGSLKAVFNCQGPLDAPLFVGSAVVSKKSNTSLLNIPSSIAEEAVARYRTTGAIAAFDNVPLSYVSANFTFNTDNHVADVYGFQAILVDGGEVRGAGCAWLCPEGETDDSALDFSLSGSANFDSVVQHYLPSGVQPVPVKLGVVNGDAKVYGSILRTKLDIKWSAPNAGGSFSDARGNIMISDEAIVLSSSSITFDLMTKIRVMYPKEYYQKRAKETVLFTPEFQGIDTDLRLRGFDIFGLTPINIIDSPRPTHLKLTGRVKFTGDVLKSLENDQVTIATGSKKSNFGYFNRVRSLGLHGEVLLSGMKLNQLFVAPNLSGTFSITPRSFKLETTGRPDESLHIDYILNEKAASNDTHSNDNLRRKGQFALQKGRLRTCASFHAGHSASLEVHQLQLDELEVASLRGLVQKAEIQLNFQKRKGHGAISVMRPRFSGLQGESLDVSARWSGDVITLEKSVLEQSFSKYELQGEYVLPGTRDSSPGEDRKNMLKTLMAGQLGDIISSMGRWRLRLEVPGAEVAEMLPLARLLSRSRDPAVISMSKELFLQGVQNIGFYAENLKKHLETTHWMKSPHADEGTPEAIPVPGLAELKGHWKGSLQASGGGNGDTVAEFDLHGEEWEWGAYNAQKVISVGCFSNNDGLRLDRIFIQRDKATLHADGSLSEKSSNLHFAVLNFPVDLVPFLLQAFKSSSMKSMPSPWTPRTPLKGILHMEGDLRGSLAKPQCDVQVRLLDGAVGGIDLKRAEVVAFVKSTNRFLFIANFEPVLHHGHVHVWGNLPVNPLRTDIPAQSIEGESPSSDGEWISNKESSSIEKDDVENVFERDRIDEDGEVTLAERLKNMDWKHLDAAAFKVKATVKDGGMMLITAISPYVRWLQGNADIDLDVGGKVDEPVFDGSATFYKALISSPVLQSPLSNFGGTINVRKNQLQIDNIEGRVGRKGRLLVEGKLPLRNGSKTCGDKIELKAENLEVRAKSILSGQVDSQIQVAGSILEPEVSGAIMLSHGEAYIPQEKGSGATISRLASNPRSLLSGSYNRPTAVGNIAKFYGIQSPLQMDESTKTTEMQGNHEKANSNGKKKPKVSVHMEALKVQFGPELRLVYPLILNFAVSGELELSGPADAKFIKPKGTLTFENGDVNLVATQVRLRRDHPNRAKFEPDQGLDPILDLALVGADWQLKIQGHASNWQDNLVVTSTRSGEQDVLSPNEAARVFESQLAESILEGDGQLAFEKLAAATLETIMPKIEGKGKLGHASWRLVSAPQIPNFSLDPQLDPLKSIANISFGAEVEVQLGKRLQASVARQLKESEMATHWTLQYQLSSRLRVLVQSIPSGDKRLLFEYSATSQD